MLTNMRGYMMCLFIFLPDFINTKNTDLSRLKTGSRKFGRNTLPPASRLIFIFSRKYENGRDKYSNTGGMGRRLFSSLVIAIDLQQ